MTIPKERLDHLYVNALRGEVQCTTDELLDLIREYREHVIDLGELEPGPGAEFFTNMVGSFLGSMMSRKLDEFSSKRCEAKRGGKRCWLKAGHAGKHQWLLVKKPKKVKR